MGRILIEQDGRYIPSTDEDIAGMGEPLGRGSSSLKKRVVRVGTRDGLPVYKLVPYDQAPPAQTPRPIPEAPRPTPGPMSKAPDYLEPYRSQTPIPEFNLGVIGAPFPTARGQGAMGATDPVAKAKAAAAAARAKQRGAVRAPIAPKREFVGPMNPTTDARRRWEERYLRADAPKPEPLDLSLPKAPEVKKPDPFEKYKGKSLADIPLAGDTLWAGAGDGSKPPVSSRESDLPPDDFSKPERTYDDLTDAERAEIGSNPAPTTEPVDGVTPVGADGDLQGKLDEAGGGMFGKRDFNAGEGGELESLKPPATEGETQKTPWTSLYTGGDQAMERKEGTTESTRTSGVKNKGLLLQAEGELYDTKYRQEKALRELEDLVETQKGTDERQRGKFAQDRQDLLAKYTQGLDDTAKARFIDTLVKNVGKIVAGGVGLHKGLDVASGYKYEGADTAGMRQDVEGAYKAGVEELEAREKERKGVADKEFERRQALLKGYGDVAQGHHQRVMDVLALEKEVKDSGMSSEVMSWPSDRVQREIELLDMKYEEAKRMGEKDKAEAIFREKELLARIKMNAESAKAARDVAKTQAKGTVENKVAGEQQEETEVSPEITQRYESEFGDLLRTLESSPAVSSFITSDAMKAEIARASRLTGDERKAAMDRIVDGISKRISAATDAASKQRNQADVDAYRRANSMLTNMHSTVGFDPEDFSSPTAMQRKFNTFKAAHGRRQKQGAKEGKESMTRVQGTLGTLPQTPSAPKPAAPSAPSEKDKKIARLKEIIADPKQTPERKKQAEDILKSWEGR